MIRLLKRLRAFLSNTFVTDCPHCHKDFYGFHAYKTHVVIGKKHYRIVCHRCAAQLEESKKM